MKTTSTRFATAALACTICLFAAVASVQPALASGDPKLASNHHPVASGAAATAGKEMAEAEIRKIDLDTKKITLKHGEIKNLDMPPMTMVFQVADEKLLSAAKTGDKVKFTAEKIRGAYTVTAIEVVTK